MDALERLGELGKVEPASQAVLDAALRELAESVAGALVIGGLGG